MKKEVFYYGKEGEPCDDMKDAYVAEFRTIDDDGNIIEYARCAVNGRSPVYIKPQIIPVSEKKLCKRLNK